MGVIFLSHSILSINLNSFAGDECCFHARFLDLRQHARTIRDVVGSYRHVALLSGFFSLIIIRKYLLL